MTILRSSIIEKEPMSLIYSDDNSKINEVYILPYIYLQKKIWFLFCPLLIPLLFILVSQFLFYIII